MMSIYDFKYWSNTWSQGVTRTHKVSQALKFGILKQTMYLTAVQLKPSKTVVE